jgi:hypothetical protein
MGQQQLLLIILGVIVVGIAIAVGISEFGAHSTQSNKDGVTSSLVNLAANAYQYKIRPSTMGGGGYSYVGYNIPSKMTRDGNGTYAIGSVSAHTISLVGTSAMNTLWAATVTADDTGNTGNIQYTGW